MKIKNKYIALFLFIVLCIVFYNIFELLYVSIFTHGTFTLQIIFPTIIGVVVGYFTVYKKY